MDKKKQLLLSIGLVLILVLMIVGISYAAFKFTGLGNKPNTITTGAITMEYEESTNTISMTGALPTTDATGKVRLTAGEYFDFTIKSNIQGNANINWEIAAEDITASAKKMNGKNIKLYLTKLDSTGAETQVMSPKVFTTKTSENTKTGRPAGMMSLATGTMSASETTKYRLRMYVDESYNPQGDGGGLSFTVKINVYGKVKEAPVGSKLKAYATEADLENDGPPETDFHTDDYRSKITSVITKKDNIVPESATKSWDMSEAGDGSVMAYVEDDGNGNSTYKLTIGGKDGIIANESMLAYFYEFSNMTSLDLSALDTAEVTNMAYMFYECSSLTKLDLTNFDTSKVTDMSSMFFSCSSLNTLDVSSFDTSQVTDMSYMFYLYHCINLTSLDVSNFDTSNVTNMDGMFMSCNGLTSLDVSNFDTSKVTDMGFMFAGCKELTNLDVSNFDTANVTNMEKMFNECSITNLDLRNFDTSKVTSMWYMFLNCSKLTQITVSNKWVIGSSTNVTYMFDGCGTDHVTTI